MQTIFQDIQLGKNIRAVRLEKGMTQTEVAVKLRLMGSMLSKGELADIESGAVGIKAGDLKALKEIFEVGYDRFFEI